MSEVGLYPIEKQVALLIHDDIGYGGEISHADLLSMLELETPEGRLTAREHQKYALTKMARIERLKDALLLEYNMLLEVIRGVGYRVVTPHDQTGVVMKDFEKQTSKLNKSAAQKLTCLDTTDLTDQELQENARQRGNVATIIDMMHRQLRLQGVTLKKIGNA